MGEGKLSAKVDTPCPIHLLGLTPGFRSPQRTGLGGRVSMVGAAGGVLRGQGPRMQPRPEARAPFEFFAYQAYLPREIEV